MVRSSPPAPMPLPVAEDDGNPTIAYEAFVEAAAEKPNPWDQHLLGRALFSEPTPEERWPWQGWREKHEVPIDEQVQKRKRTNARPRIDRDRLQREHALGWCPYFMARWHTAFAATAANQILEWQSADAIKTRLGKSSKANEPSLRGSRYDAARRLHAKNDRYRKIVKIFEKTCILNEMLFDPATQRNPPTPLDLDPSGLYALAPRTRGQIGSLDTRITELAEEMNTLIKKRIDLTLAPESIFDSDDENKWLQIFAGYMGVAWTRMTCALPAQSAPFEDWVQAGWESLWDSGTSPSAGTWASRLRHARNRRATYAAHPRFVAGPFG